jgi:hypothetical protein
MSIALTQRVKKLEDAANQPNHGLMERTAHLEAQLVIVAKGLEVLGEELKSLAGKYTALNARVGKALKKQE